MQTVRLANGTGDAVEAALACDPATGRILSVDWTGQLPGKLILRAQGQPERIFDTDGGRVGSVPAGYVFGSAEIELRL
jgi:hypothetical protein